MDNELEIQLEIQKRELSCQLTPEEVMEYGKELAKNQEEKYEQEGRKKEVNAEFTAVISRCDAQILVLTRKVRSGQETRAVDCYYDYNWGNNEKKLYRSDTGELVKIDEIEEHERQQHLKLREKEEAGASEDFTDGEDEGEEVISEHFETEEEPDTPTEDGEPPEECPDCSPNPDEHSDGCPSVDVMDDVNNGQEAAD